MTNPSLVETNLISALPLWIILIPLAGSLLVYGMGLKGSRQRDLSAVFVSGSTLAAAAILFWRANESVIELQLQAGSFGSILYYRIDALGAAITLLAALVWFLATLFSLVYMKHEEEQNRYYLFFLLSLGSCLGVFMAGDLLTLFLHFEIMTFASYVLVIHNRTEEAHKAGNSYLYLGVLGGLLLLTAIILIFFYGGSLTLLPQLEILDELGSLRYFIVLLFVAGFGIKAGAVPLHIWLPKAHPVAPSPASALLSGIMIKTGAYGIIRVVNMIYTPANPESSWYTAGQLGDGMIWLGIITMLTAAVIALFQNNAKRILAYSSISQMGYILMGIGCAAYLGYQGAMGFSGAFYHLVNHAFFKSALFILVGAVYIRTGHQLDLRKLGGLWRCMPVTTIIFIISAAGITGVPFFNGYTGKTLLHHAIVDVYEYSGAFSMLLAERIFTLTSALTVCYIIKLTTGIFFGNRPAGLGHIPGETTLERGVFITLGAAVIFLGSFPGLVMENFILPAGAGLNFQRVNLQYLAKLNFWDIHDLLAIALVLVLGAALFLLFRHRLYTAALPGNLSVEKLIYRPLVRSSAVLLTKVSSFIEKNVENSYIYSPYTLRFLTAAGKAADNAAETVLVKSLNPLEKVCLKFGNFDRELIPWLGKKLQQLIVLVRDGIYNIWYRGIQILLQRFVHFLRRLFFTMVHMDFDPKGTGTFQSVNISNLEFNLLLVVLFLLVVLSLFYFL